MKEDKSFGQLAALGSHNKSSLERLLTLPHKGTGAVRTPTHQFCPLEHLKALFLKLIAPLPDVQTPFIAQGPSPTDPGRCPGCQSHPAAPELAGRHPGGPGRTGTPPTRRES